MLNRRTPQMSSCFWELLPRFFKKAKCKGQKAMTDIQVLRPLTSLTLSHLSLLSHFY